MHTNCMGFADEIFGLLDENKRENGQNNGSCNKN
jgi:hypothetical protein